MRSLYLDDVRTPPKTRDWSFVARRVEDAKQYCLEEGCPSFVSFDHDMGGVFGASGSFTCDPSGMDFAKWLVEEDQNSGGTFMPEDFRFHVHSSNPAGAANIQSLLDGYLAHRKREYDTHVAHCNQGDYVGSCKYGEINTCPALGERHD